MLTPKRERGKMQHDHTIYGESHLGKALEIFLPSDSNPRILLVAGIHGDEPDTTVLLSDAVRSIPVGELRNAAILCANPDGTVRGTRANAEGVDLNRNFPTSNWTPDPVYYRTHFGEPQDIALSSGSEAGSEPETRALLKIIKQLKPRIVIAFHSALACIDDPHESKLGRWLADTTELPMVADVGYPTPGSFGSWANENSLPLVTFEFPAEPLAHMKTRFVPTLIKMLINKHQS